MDYGLVTWGLEAGEHRKWVGQVASTHPVGFASKSESCHGSGMIACESSKSLQWLFVARLPQAKLSESCTPFHRGKESSQFSLASSIGAAQVGAGESS